MDQLRRLNRSPWIFILLQLAGFVGYFYVGKPKRFIALCLVFLLLAFVAFHGLWGLVADPLWFLCLSVVIVLVALIFAIDTFWIALSKSKRKIEPKWYNKWWIYLLLIGIVQTLGTAFSSMLHNNQLSARTFSVPSNGMFPNLKIGDYFVLNTKHYRRNPPSRGDIVVFSTPQNPQLNFVMRVLGLPGERIQLARGEVKINGQATKKTRQDNLPIGFGNDATFYLEKLENGKSFTSLEIEPNSISDNTKEFLVPDAHYFMLGDNRDNSNDSRFDIGFVPIENIIGRVSGIYFSTDLKRIGTDL